MSNSKKEHPDWLYRQSAVLPLYQGQVVLITTRKSGRWVIPKGVVELHLSPQESAREEAWEEAGLKGKVMDHLLGEYTYEKWGGTCHVKVYRMEVETLLDHWPEKGFRRRERVSPTEAVKRVYPPALAEIIAAALGVEPPRRQGR